VGLLEGWDDASAWRDDPSGPDPLRLSLTVPSDVASSSIASGWITLDTENENVRQWTDSVVPFGTYAAPAGSGSDTGFDTDSGTTAATAADDSGTTDSSTDAAGTTTYTLRESGNGYPFDLTVDDVGAMFDFPAGTFTGPDAGALAAQTFRNAFPLAVVVALGLVTLALGLLSVAAALRRRSRRAPPGFLRDLVWWLGASAGLSTVWLFVWSTSDMPDDWPEFPPLGLSALAAVLGAALCFVFTLRRRPSTATPRPPRVARRASKSTSR
jgi:hypothetical protein